MKKLILSKKQYNNLKNVIIERSILNEQTKDEITQIQQRLKDCFNAALGKSGPNKDGVDGILGIKTKTAIETHTKYRFDQNDGSKNSDIISDLVKNPDVEAKKQEVLVFLNKLKESNTNQMVKNQIEQSITELNNMSSDSICENNQLKPEFVKKLAESKKALNDYRDFIKDPEKLIDKIIINMTFIEEYCKSRDKSNDLKQDPIKDDVKNGLNNVGDKVGDKVKSDLNNVVNPINTTISDELYYKIIAP
jgi:hypothetical protein